MNSELDVVKSAIVEGLHGDFDMSDGADCWKGVMPSERTTPIRCMKNYPVDTNNWSKQARISQ